MSYCKFGLNYQMGGTVVQVSMVGSASDVFLVDSLNLSNFERGSSFTYYGGHYTQSPAILQVPAPGNWIVVVAPPAGGSVRAGVTVRLAQ
jgi:hypothetical protein